jgi:hypothetical protein
MISRLSLYHRWRRFQVTSLAYPLILSTLTMAAMLLICWVSLQ